MEYTIYLRTNLVNGKQYVGQTKDFQSREYQWRYIKTIYANKFINEDRTKYGFENWKVEVLAEADNREDAWELEQRFIRDFNTKWPNGYNMSDGGKTNKGCVRTEETLKNMSDSHKGQTPWNRGIKNCFSEETLKNMSDSHKGQTAWNKGLKNCFSEETVKNMSEHHKGKQSPMKGKHHTEDSKKIMSEAKKGKHYSPKTEFTATPVCQLTLDGKLIAIWPSQCNAADCLKIRQGNIWLCCNGKRKSAGGFKWMYKEDYDKMLAEQAN